MNDWHIKYIELAKYISGWSKDPNTKVGCVITSSDNRILSVGYNGFPKNVPDDEKLFDRDLKNLYMVHAEQNALMCISNKPKNSNIYVTHFPCNVCSSLIVQSNFISTVIVYHPVGEYLERYKSIINISMDILSKNNVEIIYI